MVDLLFIPLVFVVALGVISIFTRDWSVYQKGIVPAGLFCLVFAFGLCLPDDWRFLIYIVPVVLLIFAIWRRWQ